MIICLSGFVIAGTSPPGMPGIPISARNDISVPVALSCAAAAGAGAGSGSYAAHHHQLLQQQLPRGAPHPRAPRAPHTSSSESVSSHSASPPPPQPQPPGRVRTLYACLGESEGELSFEPNQIITNVTPSPEPGWLRGTLNGRSGLVPQNYVEPLP